MRWLRTASVLFILGGGLWAADLNVKVLDPQSAGGRGARVTLYPGGSHTPAGLQNTSAEGLAQFTGLTDGTYDIQVLAPGFAPGNVSTKIPGDAVISINLAI